jgi:hypothetical protein
MKVFSVFAVVLAGVLWAQNSPAPSVQALPNLPDDATIAVFDDGYKFTMGELKSIYTVLPPNMQQMAANSRQEFVREYAFMRKLTRMAEQDKLHERSPYKEAIDYSRMTVLAQAALAEQHNTITVESPEIVKYYDSNKEQFKQVRLKAIYIAFGGPGDAQGKKAFTEDEARAKAEKLASEIRGGADFSKLAKENSDDETSRSKDGEFATLRPSDNVPDAIRKAVFALKADGLSDPVRQPNGFYLFQAVEVTYRPLSQVRDQIFTDLRNFHYKEWLDRTNREVKVEFPNPAFLTGGQAGLK